MAASRPGSDFRAILTMISLALPLLFQACSSTSPAPAAGLTNTSNPEIAAFYARWRGTPYAFGGSSPAGIDCSAFMQITYAELYGRTLPRTTEQQADIGEPVAIRDLAVGDLIFFRTGWKQNHVGLYVGHHEFMHASVSAGVTISSLHNAYWSNALTEVRRVPLQSRP